MSILGTAPTTNATGATTTAKSALAKKKMDKDLNQFLKLLVAQLKNQDPLKPMDATAFTQQLVQFAGVEQQIYSNANLEKLVGMQQTTQVGSMVNYLDKFIEAKGKVFNLEKNSAQFSYNLESKAVQSTLSIQDASDKTVWSGPISTDKGKNIFHWDGIKTDGTAATSGPYTAVISAKDHDGKLVNVAQTVFGRVTGAGASKGQVSLSMGAVDAPLEKVLNVKNGPPPLPVP